MVTVFWRLLSLDLHNTPIMQFSCFNLFYSFSIFISLLSTYLVSFTFPSTYYLSSLSLLGTSHKPQFA